VEGTLSGLIEQSLEVRPLSREQALWVLSYPEERVVELGRGGPKGAPQVLLRPGEARRSGQHKEWVMPRGLPLLPAIQSLDGAYPEVKFQYLPDS
jgi:hypothetical protein